MCSPRDGEALARGAQVGLVVGVDEEEADDLLHGLGERPVGDQRSAARRRVASTSPAPTARAG